MQIENKTPNTKDLDVQEQMKREMAEVAWEENMYQYQDMIEENIDYGDYDENAITELENLSSEEKLAKEITDNHAAYKLENRYFSIEEHSEGWDYNFYDKNMIVTDGGVYDDTTISITNAIENILDGEVFIGKDTLLDRTAPMLDFDEFMEEKDICEQEHTHSQLQEFAFEKNQDNSYSIYQLKHSDFTRNFRFEGIAYLERKNIDIEPSNFNNVYTASFDDSVKDLPNNEKLNYLWETFNIDHPQDFTGHSLSVSDVVALKENGEVTYHFVDSFGFKEIPFKNVVEHLHEVDTKAHITELIGIAKDDTNEKKFTANESQQSCSDVERASSILPSEWSDGCGMVQV